MTSGSSRVSKAAKLGLAAPFLVIALLIGSCTSEADPVPSESLATTTTTSASTTTAPVQPSDSGPPRGDPRLEVALVFKYHQPYLPTFGNEIALPWARLESAQSYLDVAQLISDFDSMKASVVLSSPLIEQLEALTNPLGSGRVTDRHYRVTNTPVALLTPDDRQFILNNFFDADTFIVNAFERWVELKELRDAGAELASADFRDLTVLFHLGYLDSEFAQADDDLAGLVAKGRDFSDSDARTVLRVIDSQVDLVTRTYGELYESGQVEMIAAMGPLAEGDAVDLGLHLTHTLQIAGDALGSAPQGLALVGDIGDDGAMSEISGSGLKWVLISEPPVGSANPVRLMTAGGAVEIVTANPELTEPIYETYSEMSAADAVADFIGRLTELADQQAISSDQSGTPGLVTIVIEGSGTWDAYANDGRTFLRTLFNALSTSADFAPTTPSQYLRQYGERLNPVDTIEGLTNNDTRLWQGEPEELAADLLMLTTRQAIAQAGAGESADSDRATTYLMNAQAADFGYYYGADIESDEDRVFDRAFREWLGRSYDELGLARPEELTVPIVKPSIIAADQVATAQTAIKIDGNPSDWAKATLFDLSDTGDVITEFGLASDSGELALRFDGGIEAGVEVYLGVPGAKVSRITSLQGDTLGFGATHMILWKDTQGACLANVLPPDSILFEEPAGCVELESALSETGVELKVPLASLPGLSSGDSVMVRLRTGSSLGPAAGPITVQVP